MTMEPVVNALWIGDGLPEINAACGPPLSQMLDRCSLPLKIWRLKRAGIPDRRSILGLLRLDAGQPSAYFWAPTPESGGLNGERPCPH